MNNVHTFLNHAAESLKRGDSDRALFWFEAAKSHPDADSAQERILKAENVIAVSLCNCLDVGGEYHDAFAGHFPDCPATKESVLSEWDRMLMMEWDAWDLWSSRNQVLAIHSLLRDTATTFNVTNSVVDAWPAFKEAERRCIETASRYEATSEVYEDDKPAYTVDACRLALRDTARALKLVLGDVPGLINARYIAQATHRAEGALVIADGLVAQVPGWVWDLWSE